MFEFRMPKMDHLSQECTIVEWLVKEGDSVCKGDVILRIETSKSLLEVKADFDGVIFSILVPEDETVPVQTPIALIEENKPG